MRRGVRPPRKSRVNLKGRGRGASAEATEEPAAQADRHKTVPAAANAADRRKSRRLDKEDLFMALFRSGWNQARVDLLHGRGPAERPRDCLPALAPIALEPFLLLRPWRLPMNHPFAGGRSGVTPQTEPRITGSLRSPLPSKTGSWSLSMPKRNRAHLKHGRSVNPVGYGILAF